MKISKLLAGGLAGGVVFFFMGWLVWGILLHDYSTSAFNQCSARPMNEMVWWALILSNLLTGLLIAYVFSLAKTKGIREAALTGAVLGLLISSTIDLGNYSMTTLYNNLSAILVDVLINILFFAVIGMVVVIAMGKTRH